MRFILNYGNALYIQEKKYIYVLRLSSKKYINQ